MIDGSCHCGAVRWRFEGNPGVRHGVQLLDLPALRSALGRRGYMVLGASSWGHPKRPPSSQVYDSCTALTEGWPQ
jgi:hypothetical protein